MAKLNDWIRELPCEVLKGGLDQTVEDVVYDSRKAAPDTVFVCMTGSRTDSHDFIPQVLKAGCRVLVVEKPLSELSPMVCGKDPKEIEADESVATEPKISSAAQAAGAELTILRVENGRHALALLSAARFSYPARRMRVIGLTGTKGKTTVSYLLKAMLEACGRRVGVIGTNGCEIAGVHYATKNTTPESYEIHERLFQMAEAGCEYAVMECSSQGFKMHRTDGLRFDIGIFLNISPDHIGPLEHADFEEYLNCKARIFDQSALGIINGDDPHAKLLCRAQKGRSDGFRMYRYAMDPEVQPLGGSLDQAQTASVDQIQAASADQAQTASADLTASELSYLADGSFVGTEFRVRGLLQDRIRLSLPGAFNVSNALAALCVSALLKLPEEKVREALAHVHVSGRMETVLKTDRFQVLVDYAHNEVSMESLLNTLRSYRPKRLVVVFGCGGNRSRDRRTGMGRAAALYADDTILTADNSRFEKTEDILSDIREAFLRAGGKRERLWEIPDRREAIRYAVSHAETGDMIAVIGKGHEDYQEIEGRRMHFSDREEILKAWEA